MNLVRNLKRENCCSSFKKPPSDTEASELGAHLLITDKSKGVGGQTLTRVCDPVRPSQIAYYDRKLKSIYFKRLLI